MFDRVQASLVPVEVRWLGLLVAALLSAAAVSSGSAQGVTFETDTLRIETKSGTHEFHVELASTPEQRSQGLMFRDSMPADHGMLFDFEPPRVAKMWMRDTYLPLDMLFIRSDGTISSIAESTEPQSDTVISSKEPVAGVLELNAGTTRLLGVEPGDRVLHDWFETG